MTHFDEIGMAMHISCSTRSATKNLKIKNFENSRLWTSAILKIETSISANADGPRDAASLKIDHIALPTNYN